MLLKVGTLQIHRCRDGKNGEYRTIKALEKHGFTLVLEDCDMKSDTLIFCVAYDKEKCEE